MHGEGTNQKYWYKIQNVGWLVGKGRSFFEKA